MKSEPPKVRLRGLKFTQRPATRLWQEQPSPENPYLAQSCRCHGYDLLELMQQFGFVDVMYLLLRGELPTLEQSRLLNALMVALINPGPRHAATRAAMSAGVSGIDPAHILPVSLSVLGGAYLGGTEVEAAMRFLRQQLAHDPAVAAAAAVESSAPPESGDWHVAPGFGTRFGGMDPLAKQIASGLRALPGAREALRWGGEFASGLEAHGLGWLTPGLAAAVFIDLGFTPRAGAGLFQLMGAPGLLAHGLEMAGKPITAMPFIDQEHYVIERDTTQG